tara:strand:- start:1411 stop:1671 length:261 start_codon:yes stop_codon:yes gene_type:complete
MGESSYEGYENELERLLKRVPKKFRIEAENFFWRKYEVDYGDTLNRFTAFQYGLSKLTDYVESKDWRKKKRKGSGPTQNRTGDYAV